MKIAVINFPGSNCERDVVHVLRNILDLETDLLWHSEAHLKEYDAVILPGGFSYGDYLRSGVISAFSPVLKELKILAEKGRPILGICNGFQILAEAGLLPGALMKNINLKFICKWIKLRVDTKRTAFTGSCKETSILRMPIAHNEGRYFIDPDNLQRLYKNDQVVLTYVDDRGERTEESNPNGSLGSIAGICNPEGNILGLMPHPERAAESILSPYGSKDGLLIFKSMVNYIRGS